MRTVVDTICDNVVTVGLLKQCLCDTMYNMQICHTIQYRKRVKGDLLIYNNLWIIKFNEMSVAINRSLTRLELSADLI